MADDPPTTAPTPAALSTRTRPTVKPAGALHGPLRPRDGDEIDAGAPGQPARVTEPVVTSYRAPRSAAGTSSGTAHVTSS
ncbi:hypothetical protein Apa02nite_027190 [Actinoplanes palleronii]|uniref:Uncharacterized protein n=1 Tax=Actinoplanes palleronii TaxID=113570 RepID=A0ABQ4B862_9ACTN|nr:hypothetical protein Apa02nite_027190 [Actinoplanes palleronii]